MPLSMSKSLAAQTVYTVVTQSVCLSLPVVLNICFLRLVMIHQKNVTDYEFLII